MAPRQRIAAHRWFGPLFNRKEILLLLIRSIFTGSESLIQLFGSASFTVDLPEPG